MEQKKTSIVFEVKDETVNVFVVVDKDEEMTTFLTNFINMKLVPTVLQALSAHLLLTNRGEAFHRFYEHTLQQMQETVLRLSELTRDALSDDNEEIPIVDPENVFASGANNGDKQ